ncbi:MAG TPA: hypothetical protein VF507_03080 [Pyrinomonadaceae bacterium]|jgi:hypothetical protein
MSQRFFAAPLAALALLLCLAAEAAADTIRLKDGSVIRGQVISFRDQQFTVLIGTGARGRRSRVTIYMEDVESIEFDAATGAAAAAITNDDTGPTANTQNTQAPRTNPTNTTQPTNNYPQTNTQPPRTSSAPNFFQVTVRVRADNTTNGWTNSGLVVRRGQRLRITASGRVNLGAGRFSTPAGIATLPDRDKLMRNDPTGALIAVIGDDNDEFVYVGGRREFTAQRDGVLFLGVNEGNLADNTGAYDVIIEAEAIR